MSVDVTSRSDLRSRIAETIERLLGEVDVPVGYLLPSTRTFASVLGVHRNTMRAALEILADRGVVAPAPGGRFGLDTPRVPAEAEAESEARAEGGTLAALLAKAAAVGFQHGETESAFAARARNAYRQVMSAKKSTVCFIAPEEPIAGIGADELAELLDHPVATVALTDIRFSREQTYVATSSDAATARERLEGHVDVFTVGLSLDADLRLAIAPLEQGSRVAVVADDAATLAAVMSRIGRMRPDLELDGHVGAARRVAAGTSLVLAPAHRKIDHGSGAVARYRCSIAPAEVRLIRARLGERRAHEARPGGAARALASPR
jgi:DNA-binding transcriptional regulator YhcF (GntR family)